MSSSSHHLAAHLPDFAVRLIAWQQKFGRHTLPWQGTSDPYRIWLSEIMLQQTQVESVIPYYQRFLARFPDLHALADAEEDVVLGLWSGLGYYSRARNLHAAARKIVQEHSGEFPRDLSEIELLPGIGRTTAAAVAAFAYQVRCAILDGNVKRVLTRVFGVEGWPGEKTVEAQLWRLAESLLPATAPLTSQNDIRSYTQGLMDLGATVCTRGRPRCNVCPFEDDCVANMTGRQRELPAPRPRKNVPERAVAMFVLVCAGEVWLEKRPPSGIWGGLWSFPEGAEESAPEAMAAHLGFEIESRRELDGFTHTFTHFRLFIRPWLVFVRRSTHVMEPGCIWLPLSDIEGAALPTPVRRILQSLVF